MHFLSRGTAVSAGGADSCHGTGVVDEPLRRQLCTIGEIVFEKFLMGCHETEPLHEKKRERGKILRLTITHIPSSKIVRTGMSKTFLI